MHALVVHVGRRKGWRTEVLPDSNKKSLHEELMEARKRVAELGQLVADSRSGTAEEPCNRERITEALLSSSFQSIFLIDRSGVLLAVNTRFATQFGCQPSDMLGQCVYDLLPPEVAEKYRVFMEETVRMGRPNRLEDWREGQWLCVTVYPIVGRVDGTWTVLVCEEDITEHKRTQEELERSNRQLEFILNNSGDVVYLRNLRTDRYDYISPVIERCIGSPTQEVINLGIEKIMELMHPDDRSILDREIQLTSKGEKEVGTVEYRLWSKSGQYKWIADCFSQFSDGEGHPSYRVGIARDITEEKETKEALTAGHEALAKAEEKYRNLFLNATEGIFQTTPEGVFLSANPALARILGYASAEHLMTEVTDIGKQVIVDDVKSAYPRIADEAGIMRDFECRVRKTDGTIIWASLNGRVVRDNEGKVLHYEGTFQDITQRKLARQQLITQRDVALRLAQITDFREGLTLILRTAIDVSEMERGGIWLKKEPTGDLELILGIGLPDDLIRSAGRLAAGSPVWSLVMEGKNRCMSPGKEFAPLTSTEGFTYGVLLPIRRYGRVIGSLNTGSNRGEGIPEHGRITLDFLSAESGNIIARMEARERLEREVETRREAEKALQTEQVNLQETNAALRVLLRHREEDKKEIGDRVATSLKQLVLPYVERLKKSRLEPPDQTMIGFIETNLKEILSPFLDNVQRFKLTPRQIEIVALIKEGRTTKDIAELLRLSKAAVDKQRFLIRKRLDLNKAKTNLRSYLLSLV